MKLKIAVHLSRKIGGYVDTEIQSQNGSYRFWEVTFENKTHSPKKCKPVSRVYVHHKAVNEKYILCNDACTIHTDLMVKHNIYKHYYIFNVDFKLSIIPFLRRTCVANVNSRVIGISRDKPVLINDLLYVDVFTKEVRTLNQILSYSSLSGASCKLWCQFIQVICNYCVT